MSSAKILLRSQILELLSKLKTSKNFSDNNVERIIAELKHLGDDDFVVQTLIKEINCLDANFDSLLLILAREISPSICEKHSFDLLQSKTITDRKKLFLINNLRDMGQKVDYNDIQTYITNPDEVVDMETKNFLEAAKINPEAQIDFLDFFLTVNDVDKKLLLDSIVADFNGDELANVITPIIFYNPLDPIVPYCIEALKKCKSYIAFEPLKWIIESVDDDALKSQARRVINELKLLGLRENFSKKELYAHRLQDSKPIGYWASLVDGADNFSLIFARERDGGEISTFFTVINLNKGAAASFGFNDISKEEFDTILKRFFADSPMIKLDISIGQKLLENSFNAHKIPYELLCWRVLTYDIDPFDKDLDAHFIVGLQKKQLNSTITDKYIENWFFKYGDNAAFDAVIDRINEHRPQTIGAIDVLIEDSMCNIFSNEEPEIFNRKLLYQAYFVSLLNDRDAANALYSLIEPSDMKSDLLLHIVQKSIYKYFLERRQKPDTGKVYMFSKEGKQKSIDYDFYIKLIESEWVE